MDAIENLLTRGVDKIYPSPEALEKVLRSGKKLKLYQGFDPTGTQLHIGHMAGLRKLRQFQELGHEVIFLIGDQTAMIGDPSGKSTARKVLSHKEVMQNAETYPKQVSKLLDFVGPNPVKILYNGDWLSKLSAIEFLNLAHYFSYQQVIERDMFQERLKRGDDLYANELVYPILQAYDSVHMNIDLEIGGTDQMFNMMMGRKLMSKVLKKEKFVMTLPLLTDSRGIKIGKSEGNVIALTDQPNELFGKIMALGDDVIVKGFEYLTDVPLDEIKKMENEMKKGANPIDFKKQLAHNLVTQLHSETDAQNAQKFFETTFQKKKIDSSEIPTVSLNNKNLNVLDLLLETKLTTSKSESRRLIDQKAVEINGEIITDKAKLQSLKSGDIIKVGKSRFAKIV